MRGRRDSEPSLEAVRSGPRLRPDLAQARAALSEATARGENSEIAAAECELGLALAAARDEHHARLAFDRATGLGDPDQTPRALRNHAASLWNDGDTERATALLRRAVALRHPMWSGLAALDLVGTTADDSDAVELLRSVLTWTDRPQRSAVRVVQARLSQLDGDIDAAISGFEAVLSERDADLCDIAAIHLAAIYSEQGDQSAAERVLRVGLDVIIEHARSTTSEAQLRLVLGSLLARRGDLDTGREELARAAALGSRTTRAWAYLELGMASLQRAELARAPRRRRQLEDQAIDELTRAMDTTVPRLLTSARIALAFAHKQLGQFETACAILAAAVDSATSTQRPGVLLNYAEMLAATRHRDKAHAVIAQVITTGPPEIHDRAHALRIKIDTDWPKGWRFPQ